MNGNYTVKLPSPLEVLVIIMMSWYESIYPQQGSEEAMKRRALTVGCSEISKANSTKADKLALIKNKLGLIKQAKAISLAWGHIFEDSCRLATEVLLDCTVYNAPGSIRHKNGFISCSPDGVGVVRVPHSVVNRPPIHVRDLGIARGGKYNFDSVVDFEESLTHYQRYRKINNGMTDDSYSNKVNTIYHDRIALFEFKSPISRGLIKEVPYQYSFQVLAGMNVVDICEYGVYSESRFVCCSKEQFGFNDEHIDFDSGEIDTSLLFHGITPFMIGCKFFIYKDTVDNDLRDELGFTCVECRSNLHYIENSISAVVDYYCIDCCFVANDEYSSRRLLIDLYTKLRDIPVTCSFDELAKAYYTYVYHQDISPLITLMVRTYRGKTKDMFAIQLWKLMSNQIVYFNRVIDFADNQLAGAIDVIESVKMLNGRFDAEDVISSVPRKRGSKGNVSGDISDLLKSGSF